MIFPRIEEAGIFKDNINSASLICFADTIVPTQSPGVRSLDSFLTKLMGR